MNRMEWAVSRQRLGVRRPSGALAECGESGRGLPHSKTWRRSSALLSKISRTVKERFMGREHLQRLDVNHGHEPEGAMGSAGVSPAGFGVSPNPRGCAPGCFRSARRRPVQPGRPRSPFEQPRFMGRWVRCALVLFVVSVLLSRLGSSHVRAGDPLDASNVVWDSPSVDSSGSMPLGNGDLGLNLWVEKGGDLLFYLGKTDAWDEHARLLKLGRVRVRIEPNPFREGSFFRQELKLRQGEIRIAAGASNAPMTLRIWAEANHPIIWVEAESQQPIQLEVSLEMWRKEKRALLGDEANGVDGFARDQPPMVYPDVIVEDSPDRVIWYHRNTASLWPATLRHQGLEALLKQAKDPLLDRTFGGAIRGDGLTRIGPTTLRSARPASRFAVAVHALTAQTETPAAWLAQLERAMAAGGGGDREAAREAHRQWWDEFWNRSWVRVTASREVNWAAAKMARNGLPLRLGADSDGKNRFTGDLGRVAIFDRALTGDEIIRRVLARSPDLADWPGPVAEWDFGNGQNATFASQGATGLIARAIGDVRVVEGPSGPGSHAVRLNNGGFLEVAPSAALDLEAAVTLEAWVRPALLPGSGARIIDKSEAGTSNGYLLDTYPAHSARFLVQDGALTHAAKLPAYRWTHLAAVFDARTGEKKIYLNGKAVASREPAAPTRPAHEVATQGYALQRFINASGGRGAFPIKFNGSIFNVDVVGQSDADYRRWGGCYWFQNTRLPYWPMLAAGDFDLLLPLFRMYREALPLAQARTQIYYRHDGAFFPETMYFWGVYANGEFGYGWDRADEPFGRARNRYIRFYWSGGLELTALMIDYFALTQDREFFRANLLPLAEAILEFYARHYPREPSGRILFAPAQALETWWECENPMPEVAGLRFVLSQLLALPNEMIGETRRAAWRQLFEELPPIPVKKYGEPKILWPAEGYRTLENMENPELYAVFPYRLFGVGKPDLEVGRATFARRRFQGNHGWQQDDTQAAFLGLAEQARRFVVNRLATSHRGSRFPAFWGPNFDWIPDQDHGGNGLMALQTMLLQSDGEKILLFPAWPKDWDVEFKLHAPFRTTVEGVYRNGKVGELQVTPAARARDVITLEPQ